MMPRLKAKALHLKGRPAPSTTGHCSALNLSATLHSQSAFAGTSVYQAMPWAWDGMSGVAPCNDLRRLAVLELVTGYAFSTEGVATIVATPRSTVSNTLYVTLPAAAVPSAFELQCVQESVRPGLLTPTLQQQ